MSLSTTAKQLFRMLQTAVVDDHDDEDHEGEVHDSDHEGEEHDSDHEGEEHGDHEGQDDHEKHDESKDEGIDVDTLKIILMICMILCVGLGFIPKAWGKCRNDAYILSFLNCFSAGIFLGMSLVHMMPESAEVYGMWAACEGIEDPFPLPYVMYFIGYMFILSIDRVLAKAYHIGHDHEAKGEKASEAIRPANFRQSQGGQNGDQVAPGTEMTPV